MLKTFFFCVIALASCILVNALSLYFLGVTSTSKMLTQFLQILSISIVITIILMRHGDDEKS